MSATMKQISSSYPCADAAAGVLLSIKSDEPPHKKFKSMIDTKKDDCPVTSFRTPMLTEAPKKPVLKKVAAKSSSTKTPSKVTAQENTASSSSTTPDNTAGKTKTKEDKRQYRLEQNRRAAKVSRERKKSMVDEIQRSINMISDANAKLKTQNAELDRLMALAQAQVDCLEGKSVTSQPANATSNGPCHTRTETPAAVQSNPAVPVVAASQAMPLVAAAAAPVTPSAAFQQPGVTLQAMMDFQKAATNAMQLAMLAGAMQQQPQTPSMLQQQQLLSAVAMNPQQAYMDHLTAFALQQSLANVAMTVPTLNNPLVQSNVLAGLPLQMGQFFLWQQQQQQQQQQQRQNS